MATRVLNVFQKRFSEMDLAMFCFPADQPPIDPYNCSLVTLQLLRMMTPAESNTLISMYSHGVSMAGLNDFITTLSGKKTSLYPLKKEDKLSDSIYPGFATFINLRVGDGVGHSMVMWRTPTGRYYVIDAQTGKIYADTFAPGEAGFVNSFQDFLTRHGFTNASVFVYNDDYVDDRIHGEISDRIDYKISKNSLNVFYKRGHLVRTGVTAVGSLGVVPSRPGEVPTRPRTTRDVATTSSDDVEMASVSQDPMDMDTGGKRRKTKKHRLTRKSSSRLSNLSRKVFIRSSS